MVGTIDIKGLYKEPIALPNPTVVRVTDTSTTEPSVATTVPVTIENPNPMPEAGSTISYQLATGYNFAVGANLTALGFPGASPASLRAGYKDIGAAQRQEAGGGSKGEFVQ